jgi:hypothetical protein
VRCGLICFIFFSRNQSFLSAQELDLCSQHVQRNLGEMNLF